MSEKIVQTAGRESLGEFARVSGSFFRLVHQMTVMHNISQDRVISRRCLQNRLRFSM